MTTKAVSASQDPTWEMWIPPVTTTSYEPKSWRPVEAYVTTPPSAPRSVRLFSAPAASEPSSASDYDVWREESLEIAVGSFHASAEAWPEQ